MVLPMTRPYKHPKTGVYWLRKRVPADLVDKVGREMVTQTLDTKDPEEAKRRLPQVLADLEAKWATLRVKPLTITDREAHLLAREVGDNWFSTYRDNPSEQFSWHTNLFENLFAAGRPEASSSADGHSTIEMNEILRWSMRTLCINTARSILEDKGFEQDEWSLLRTARAVGEALQRASIILQREERGEYEPGAEPTALSAPKQGEVQHPAALHRPAAVRKPETVPETTMSSIVSAWWRESQALGRKPSTYESYSNTFSNFTEFVGHDDIARVTRGDVVRFKDHRVSTPSRRTGVRVSAATVASDLAGLKAVFGWAVSNGHIDSNPVERVTIKAGKKRRLRSLGFSDDEAIAILKAALSLERGGERPKTYFAKRWVPWLCAFTGARVGELAQLRREDVRQDGELTIIRITPEAGTVKTNEAREVPLHPQLVELGFPAFVKSSAAGHLFLNVKPDGDPLGVLQSIKNRLAEFSREIVPDPNVAPNHGWRHRFKTVGMEVGIAPRILDAIQGQAPRTVAETYGDVTLKTKADAVKRFPRYKID